MSVEQDMTARQANRWQLATRVAITYLGVRRDLRRSTPQDLVSQDRQGTRRREDPIRLSRAVSRVLARGGESQVRCIHRAVVLHRLLAAQGDRAELVIGLLPESPDPRAHAWVELDGRDIGPAPGRNGHEPMARWS